MGPGTSPGYRPPLVTGWSNPDTPRCSHATSAPHGEHHVMSCAAAHKLRLEVRNHVAGGVVRAEVGEVQVAV